jgi:hypothetical protein
VIEIRPIVQATGPDNPAKQISVTNWNLGHALTAAPSSLIGTDGTGAAVEYPLGDFLTPGDLSIFTAVAPGLAPASGGGAVKYLRADGTWAAPPGSAGGLADGDMGDVVVSGGGAVLTVESAAPADGSFDITGKVLVKANNSITATGSQQLQIGEPGNTQDGGWQLRVGYWVNGTTWQGVINALANSLGTILNLNPSGGDVVCGGNVIASGNLTLGSQATGGTPGRITFWANGYNCGNISAYDGNNGLYSDFDTHVWRNTPASFNFMQLNSSGLDVYVGTIKQGGAQVAMVSQLANYLPLTGGYLYGDLYAMGAASYIGPGLWGGVSNNIVSICNTNWPSGFSSIQFKNFNAANSLQSTSGAITCGADGNLSLGATNIILQAGGSAIATVDANGLTLTAGKGIASTPREQAVVSAATVTPAFTNDIVIITAQAVGLTLANWSGTAVPNHGLAIRIKSAAIQTIAYGTNYRAIGVTLPTATVAGKTLYLGCIYNATDGKFDVIAVAQEA